MNRFIEIELLFLVLDHFRLDWTQTVSEIKMTLIPHAPISLSCNNFTITSKEITILSGKLIFSLCLSHALSLFFFLHDYLKEYINLYFTVIFVLILIYNYNTFWNLNSIAENMACGFMFFENVDPDNWSVYFLKKSIILLIPKQIKNIWPCLEVKLLYKESYMNSFRCRL